MNRKSLWTTFVVVTFVVLGVIVLSRDARPIYANGLSTHSTQTSTWWKGSYPVSQAYGCTTYQGEPLDPRCPSYAPRFHAGIDIAMPCGTPLYAPVAVVVSVGGPEGGRGFGYGPYYPRIRLPDGHDVILGHVQQTVVSPGQHLKPGDLIAYSGTEGNSSGCHLHFEVRTTGGAYGTSINPGPFLNLTSSVPPPFNPRYVTNLYHDVLGRAGSSSDVQTWVNALNQGASLAQVANSFLTSPEYRTNLVATDYQQILHRSVDSSGSAFYVGQLNNGAKNENVLVGLAASDEYFANRGGGTNSGFVNALYQDLLQRAADPSGLAYWTQQLNNGVSRATVAQGLITSTEYRTRLVDSYYQHYLGRNADPSGESYFISILNNGGTDESVIVGLVASDEYYAKQQAS